jgi:uncharacterized peroxidase-related enzyme
VLGDLVTFDHRRAPVTERQHAILRYVERITRTPLDCSEADLAELRGHGLSERDLWDVAEVAALFNFTNRLALATGMAPNAEYHAMAR